MIFDGLNSQLASLMVKYEQDKEFTGIVRKLIRKSISDHYETRGNAAHAQEMSIEKNMKLHYDLKTDVRRGEQNHLGRMTEEQKKKWWDTVAPRNEAFEKQNPTGDELVRWKFQRYIRDYMRCIHAIDEQVGRLLDYLEKAASISALTASAAA